MSFQASIARNRRLLKLLVSTHVLGYRFSRGALGARFNGLPVLLLTTIGRKSGKPQTVPVVYMNVEDTFIISPGVVHCPGWYLNLKNEPDATVRIGAKMIRVRASEADSAERDRLWTTVPRYWKEYQKTYPGPIPLIVLRPIREVMVRPPREPTLRYVHPTTPPGVFVRWYATLAATRLGRFFSRQVSWRLDPLLLQATGGRLSTTLVFPTAVLETRGAKSGQRRRNAIIYFHDGDKIIVVASNAGAPAHPAWYHNLRANPDVTFGGIPARASVINDEDRCQRLWVLADRVFPAFAKYRRDATRMHRKIPLVEITPETQG